MGHKWSEEAKARGRRKLTPELIDAICEIVSDGNYARTACRTLGVPFSTFYDWRQRGVTDPDSIFGTFKAALDMAEAAREMALVKQLRDAADGGKSPDWRGPAHLLARLYPGRWSERAAGDGEDEQASMFRIDQDALLERLTDDELRTLMGLMRKAAGDGHRESLGPASPSGFHGSDVSRLPGELAPPAPDKKT